MSTDDAAVAKWRRGHEWAARRRLELLGEEGPKPAQAVLPLADGTLASIVPSRVWVALPGRPDAAGP